MSQYKELKPRNAAPWAILLAFSAACGDSQLDRWQGSDESLFVVPADWSTLYAPQLDAVTPFPFLEEAEQPRFESSDPGVAEVELYVQELDEPRFRAAWIRTRQVGDADIQLWDGQELVHTESIRVREPAALELDLQPPQDLPDWARDPEVPLRLLPLSQGEAIARFYDDVGNEMVAAGRIESAVGVTLDPDIYVNTPDSPPTSLWVPGTGLLRRLDDQLSSGDRVQILSGTPPQIAVYPSGTDSRELREELLLYRPFEVEGLEILVEWEPEAVTVVVYGRRGEGRVMGLNPVVTLDGESDRVLSDPGFPWVLRVDLDPNETEPGTLEIRWRDFVETIQLNGGE